MAFIGSIVTAVGQVVQGVAAKKAADVQAEVSDTNATLAVQSAKRSIDRGQIDQYEQDLVSQEFMGTQIAVQGASGVEVSSKSSKNARIVAKRLARLDAVRVRENAQQEARAYKTAAYGYSTDADLLRRTGRSALIGGILGGAGTLISGAASAFGGKT